jgi:hypothetical protein
MEDHTKGAWKMIDPTTAILIPLKAKYRIPGKIMHRPFDPPEGTGVYSAGRFKSKTSNQGTKEKSKQSLKPRQRSYGPW